MVNDATNHPIGAALILLKHQWVLPPASDDIEPPIQLSNGTASSALA